VTHLTEIALLDLLERGHAAMLGLCNELERIADALPNNVDRQACLSLGRIVADTTAKIHRREEDVLFPALLASRPQQRDLGATLDRLRLEHKGDECYAEEVDEALTAFGEGRRSMSADAIGYLLRGFFEGQRRHVAFEKELVAPLLTPQN